MQHDLGVRVKRHARGPSPFGARCSHHPENKILMTEMDAIEDAYGDECTRLAISCAAHRSSCANSVGTAARCGCQRLTSVSSAKPTHAPFASYAVAFGHALDSLVERKPLPDSNARA